MRAAGKFSAASVALVAAALLGGPASAQSWDRQPWDGAAPAAADYDRAPPRARPRIEVRPNRQLVRVCEDWLALERRPSGDVLTPQMRCHWAFR
ncbi:hypothetical protein A33M_3741 [Rhodovulum sp. PH10]|uniref:hypothetical protein n=1 Tax=Rhodovulum sp. PH10 TaxID=1187851 RepID=UPI00027C2064|nr:hypothetical protein [Rhodovulum sp. PH10]EJW11000.1 hypothetical protein A33M_3741 [Rhodovulum sp. PH10]